jgi:hypothetical protein
MTSKLKANLILLSVTAILCLMAGEISFRVIRPDLLRGSHMPTIMTPDDTLGWRGIASSVKQHRVGNTVVEIRTNDLGFRDDPFPKPGNPKGKKRIMFLGDSFCWGLGTEKNDRISEAFDRLDSTFESFNLGIYGYSTDQELLSLKMYGPRIQPDEVVLLFCLNDLVYNNSNLGHRMPKPLYHKNEDGSLTLGNVPVPRQRPDSALNKWLLRHSALYMAYSRARGMIEAKMGLKKVTRSEDATRAGQGRRKGEGASIGVELTPYLLAEMRDECHRLGAKLTVIVVPSSQEWTENHSEAPKEATQVDQWCKEQNIQVLDLFPDFHQRYKETGENLYVADFEDQMHWNANGHHLAARILYNYFAQRGSLPKTVVN